LIYNDSFYLQQAKYYAIKSYQQRRRPQWQKAKKVPASAALTLSRQDAIVLPTSSATVIAMASVTGVSAALNRKVYHE